MVDRELVTRKMALILDDLRAVRPLADKDLADYLASPTDEVLADKIRSEVLTRQQYPRGQLNVSVQGGIAELRGTLEDRNAIADLEQEVRKLSGVLDVRNLIHLPDEPAPNIKDARTAQERARRS